MEALRTVGRSDQGGSFMRKGEVGDWRNHLNDDQVSEKSLLWWKLILGEENDSLGRQTADWQRSSVCV